ncbi:MAG: hypothetical protein V1659_02235 [Candidatus Woesearchaeota archaeon]
MKKPYIKKFGKVSNFTVWIVDGNYIRTNLDEEFTNFGQHFNFAFIPKNEFWIDREHGDGDETAYFVNNMLAKNWFMSKGKGFDEAYDKGNEFELMTREMFEDDIVGKKLHKRQIKKRIHKKLLKSYSKGIKVWVVYGRVVRNTFYLDFTLGGHDKVYKFVPAKEIWIDDAVSQKERKFILLHEIHERNLMSRGLSYIDAHRKSHRLEQYCRLYPKKFIALYKKELNKLILDGPADGKERKK